MKKLHYTLGLSLALSSLLLADNLGTISVESSTIDDRFESKKTEVSSISTLSGDTVDKAHVENIDDILKTIPGVTSEVTAGDSFKIHIRGVENQMYMGEKPGVAVVIDGVPVFERTGRVNIDLDNIESIKVIKGGASYLFGDDALSGAVIITTKRGAKYDNSYFATEAGSYGFYKFLARQGWSNDKLNGHIQVSQRGADGYHEDSEYKAKYVNGKLQYYINDSSDITFGMEYSKRQKDSHGTVGGVTQAENNPESIFDGDMESRDYTRKYDVELQKYFLTYSNDLSDKSNLLISAYVYKDDTAYISAPQTKDELGNRGTFSDDDYLYNNDYSQIQKGIKSEYRLKSDKWAALLGLDLRDNSYDNLSTYRVGQRVTFRPPHVYAATGDDKSNNSTDEQVLALYGEFKYALTDKLHITSNYRYDKIKLDYSDSRGNELNREFDVSSYRLGLNYAMSDNFSLYANYSTGFRAPTISQLFAGDVSTWGSTINNPDLEPEKAHNYEVGMRAKVGSLFYDLSLFRLDRKDFIMKSSGNYGDTDATDMWANIGGAKHQGAELSVRGKLMDNLTMNLAYTYLDATYADYANFGMSMDSGRTATVANFDVTGNEIPRTPKHRLNLGLEYTYSDALSFNANIESRSEYFADDLNRLDIDGHTTLDLGVNYNFKVGDAKVNLFAKVDNVFDKQYYSSARANDDRDENGVFNHEDLSITVNQGRFYSAGVSIKF
ncbi:MAG: TonB-dependent receptor [Campylobacterota bacterium]|nr:TonB-dependent receptor [Campylobacterota bacterium]